MSIVLVPRIRGLSSLYVGQGFYTQGKKSELPKAWANEPTGCYNQLGESIREEHVFWVLMNLRGQVSIWKSQLYASKKTSFTS